MKHMNDTDLAFARRRFTRAAKPNRLGLVLVIEHLAEWTNWNSDGWAYWLPPRRAAQRAIALVESTTNAANDEQERVDITTAEMLAAVRPIKSFCTKMVNAGKMSADQREIILRGAEPLD